MSKLKLIHILQVCLKKRTPEDLLLATILADMLEEMENEKPNN